MTTNTTITLVRSQVLGRSTLKVTANGYVNVVANSSVNSELSNSNGTVDPVIGATVTGLWWSAQTTPVQVTRGNSTVNSIISLSGSGSLSRATGWQGDDTLKSSANLVFLVKETSTLWIELTKVY